MALFSAHELGHAYAIERLPLLADLVVGGADVLYESAEYRCPVILPHHNVAQELPHEGHVGDLAEEDHQVGCGECRRIF